MAHNARRGGPHPAGRHPGCGHMAKETQQSGRGEPHPPGHRPTQHSASRQATKAERQRWQEKLVWPDWNPDSQEMDTCDESELKWKFVMGLDETALRCEMGLYMDFQVDTSGIPSGFSGFEDLNMEKWGGMFGHGQCPNMPPHFSILKYTDVGGLKNYRCAWTRINLPDSEACGTHLLDPAASYR